MAGNPLPPPPIYDPLDSYTWKDWFLKLIAIIKSFAVPGLYTTGDILYASDFETLTTLHDVATGNVLLSGGVGAPPSYGKVGLATHVSGNLPVTNLNSGSGANARTVWHGDGTWKPEIIAIGNDGQDGEDGLMGPPGIQGIQGVQGFSISGFDGNDGEDGYPGPPGLMGLTGISGSPGFDGQDGEEGSPGIPGPIGGRGGTGATGAKGNQGIPGADGESGEDGAIFLFSQGINSKSTLALFDHYADVNNGTTVETDLYSDTLIAGQLTNNGDKVLAMYQLVCTGAALASQEMRVYFGGTSIYDSGALSIGAITANFTFEVSIIRESSTVVRAGVAVSTDFATLFPYSKYTRITGLTLSNTQILKITGQASGAGGASNQITASMGYVEYLPAA